MKTLFNILIPLLLAALPLLVAGGRFLPEYFGDFKAAFDGERAALDRAIPGLAVEVVRPRPRLSETPDAKK